MSHCFAHGDGTCHTVQHGDGTCHIVWLQQACTLFASRNIGQARHHACRGDPVACPCAIPPIHCALRSHCHGSKHCRLACIRVLLPQVTLVHTPAVHLALQLCPLLGGCVLKLSTFSEREFQLEYTLADVDGGHDSRDTSEPPSGLVMLRPTERCTYRLS